jgi:hypothetical protein
MTTPDKRTAAESNGNLNKRLKPKQPIGFATWVLLIISFSALAFAVYSIQSRIVEEPIETITREGVVTQIQQLNRLQTVAFSVDTVVTSQRQGSWLKLWQDEQKGLFIVRGRVDAGIGLSDLSPEMVQIVQSADLLQDAENAAQTTDANTPVSIMPQVNITLPPSEIFSVYLDDIEIYDWQTGAFGLMQVDPKILQQAQSMAKKEVLERACRGDVMNMALENAQIQLQQLFSLTGAIVTVSTQGAGACQLPVAAAAS